MRSALALMLACPTAMFLAWGPDLLCFYNDAYRPILGYRLDTALGRPFREVWASIWDEIEPLVNATLAGESQKLTDVLLDLSREGRPEQSRWSFTYSPVFDDAGAIGGLFCVGLTGWLWTGLIERISQDGRSRTCGEVRRRARSRWCSSCARSRCRRRRARAWPLLS